MKNNKLNSQEVYEKKLKKDKEYMCLQERHSLVWNELKDQLSKNQLKLLLELDSINNELGTIEQETFYESGLKDRIK